MSVLDWLIVVCIAVLFVLAVRYSWRHRGQCGGNCTACRHCESCERQDKNTQDITK